MNNRTLFLAMFASPSGNGGDNDGVRWLQRMRCHGIPRTLSLPVPRSHYLDADDVLSNLASALMIFANHALGWLERWIFYLARARVVHGQEPWKLWERAAARQAGFSGQFLLRDGLGSVRRNG